MVVNKINIKRILKLYAIHAKIDLAWLMRDTKYAFINIIADVISSVASVSGIFLLAMRFEGIGGMQKFEVLFMMGYITCVTGIFQLFFSMNNVGHISRRIGRGQLEHMFIQPVPFKWQLATEGFIPFTGSSNLFCGIAIVAFAIAKLGIAPPVWWYLSFVSYLIVSTAIIITQSYLISSLAFYAPSAMEEISTLVIDDLGSLSNYPLSGMPKWLSLPLITVLPYGLLGWLPSMVLLGKAPFNLAHILPFIVLGTLFLITLFIFKKGFKHYVTTGSNRYTSIGFRN